MGFTVRGRVLHLHRHRLGARGGPLRRDGVSGITTYHRSVLANTPRVAVTAHVVGAQRQHIVGQRTRSIQTDVVVAGDGQRQGVVHRHLDVLRLRRTCGRVGGVSGNRIGVRAGQERLTFDGLHRHAFNGVFSISQTAVLLKRKSRQRGVRIGDLHRGDLLTQTDGLLLVGHRQRHQRVHVNSDSGLIRTTVCTIQARERGSGRHRDGVGRN